MKLEWNQNFSERNLKQKKIRTVTSTASVIINYISTFNLYHSRVPEISITFLEIRFLGINL